MAGPPRLDTTGERAHPARPPRRSFPARLRRLTGRQFARLATLCQRARLLAAAELSLRAATGLSGVPAWQIRLARVRRARERWDDAAAAASAAVRGRPDLAGWHAECGQLHEHREDWLAAGDSYREASRRAPGRGEWRGAAVRCYLAAGRPDLAIEAGTERLPGRADGSGPAAPSGELVGQLVDASIAVGDWRSAAELLREQVDRRPGDPALRLRLVDCLEQLYLVPFRLDHRGAITAEAAAPAPAEAFAEATGQLQELITRAPKKSGPPHRLGLLYERNGDYGAAADAYRLAMERMAAIDAWWCHRAAHEWAFRLAYVTGQLAPDDGHEPEPDDGALVPTRTRLRRSVRPAPDRAEQPPAGFFDAMVFRHGLQISGFLLPGPERAVDLYLDDQHLKQVRVQATGWRPMLRYDLTHGLLSDFPERSRLTIRAGDRPLVTTGGATALEIAVPEGSGEAAGKLAGGVAPTKKGTWPRTGSSLSRRQGRYLRVYERARDLLEEQGRRLFLCYGTLLGCHREGGFIPGDDDFDVSYTSRAADPVAFRQECRQVALALLRQGMDINFSINGRLFKAGLDGVWIDITPMWFHLGRAWSFDAHDLTPEAFEPVQVTQFLDRKAYLPRDPEALLADTYGPDWRTPHPEFRYYRSKEDDQVLSQMWARPSEAREFARLAEQERAGNPDAGRFAGVGPPAYPGFSWLTVPDGPRLPG